ncbi:MAG: AAA family ATPase [Bacillota bacterium]|jgi:SpoVK/Ycf46/Vps4 family AAA+-type ATPase
MDYCLEIMKIIEGGMKRDQEKVKNYSKLLTEKLRKDGNDKLAKRIERILHDPKIPTVSVSSLQNLSKVPFDQESRLSIADTIYPNQIDTEVILSEENKNIISKFINYIVNSDKILAAGLDIPNSLLLYGPPGCGKTEIAKFVAKNIDLPIVIARLDALVSSYLGSTAKNIRHLFDYVKTNPCVLFLDEFDAIAKMRDDSHELGELKRVVNSLLQNIDSLGTGTILIAATNHEQLLDPAVWRRFIYKVKIDKPTVFMRHLLVEKFIDGRGNLSKKDMAIIAEATEGLSGAEIEQICKEAIRDSIIHEEQLSFKTISQKLLEQLSMLNEVPVQNKKYFANYFKTLKPDFFSYAAIGRILGVSKTTVCRYLRKEGKEE